MDIQAKLQRLGLRAQEVKLQHAWAVDMISNGDSRNALLSFERESLVEIREMETKLGRLRQLAKLDRSKS